MQVEEGGSNFSAGEKQLLCLARAILRRSRVVVMDEATANIDEASSAKINSTVRSAFKDSTVCTIAHRLQTVIDYDKILVLDKGRVAEYDAPHLLLQKGESGQFWLMVHEMGQQNEALLHNLAKQKYLQDHPTKDKLS